MAKLGLCWFSVPLLLRPHLGFARGGVELRNPRSMFLDAALS